MSRFLRTFPVFLTSRTFVADLKYPTPPRSIEGGVMITFGGISSSSMCKTILWSFFMVVLYSARSRTSHWGEGVRNNSVGRQEP